MTAVVPGGTLASVLIALSDALSPRGLDPWAEARPTGGDTAHLAAGTRA